MPEHRLELTVLPDRYAICRLEAAAALPEWTLAPGGLVSITRTDEELAIVCPEDRVPADFAGAVRGWHGLKVHGPLPLETVGVMAALAHALAEGGVSLYAMSTYDTDYLLVPHRQLGHAVRALRHRGHTVHTPLAQAVGA
ncbi:MAG TPA: ACT domain-containing protein [Vicinamibacterales bacterium]